jgi:flavin-dependent thymidylate synthase
MKVSLLNFTINAVELLLFTKQTRLQMSPDLLVEIATWSPERKEDELAYMSRTIPSSWEFVDYVFLIEDVTRGFTHQFVRTRTASFAQQTMRVLNVKGWTFGKGPSISTNAKINDIYENHMVSTAAVYDEMIAHGAEIEDARGVLPTAIHTNIVVKLNLRTLSEMFAKRGSARTQAEYRDVLASIKEQVLRVHPWAVMFITPRKHSVAERLKQIAQELFRNGMKPLGNEILKEAEIVERELA